MTCFQSWGWRIILFNVGREGARMSKEKRGAKEERRGGGMDKVSPNTPEFYLTPLKM